MTKKPIIPENAELVFSWVRSRIYQWDQEMYDGSIARFERIRFVDGSFVIPILPDGRILLTRQEQPGRSEFISLPGGSFDSPDEDPSTCALRELREETWYVGTLSLWMTYHGTNNVHTEVYYYIARDCAHVSEVEADPGEKISLFSVSFDEFLELSSDPGFHHHWNLLPILYEARLHPEKKEALRKILYGK
jgi:ADP-ribose pyrophosphatase